MQPLVYGSKHLWQFILKFVFSNVFFFSQLVSEFLHDPRTHAPPQSFRMGDLLHEMKEIEQRNLHHTPVRGINKWVLNVQFEKMSIFTPRKVAGKSEGERVVNDKTFNKEKYKATLLLSSRVLFLKSWALLQKLKLCKLKKETSRE